ncbi:DDE-type integrase/transposase/recombinase [Pseudorhodobacter turbinis]|uniref:DDE-type integrase/transposase/recombinase n=1 Tax=Pseudorhodobacter turbinis TaxID=2500533 RepID=A0A4P8ECS2_9RHOB|nr:DDE-type integrase/transposase/recombinase [Pseudorhodobacter turbinis]QCO54443.1 DDE-type integrase/transposase/recombinase [Pseudorhodobacter turbinis]
MELNFNNISVATARYAFSTSDQVVIEGTAWRPHSFNELGWVMELSDGSGMCREFSHEQLRRLGSMGRVRHDRGFYNPAQAGRRLTTTSTLVSSLSKKRRAQHSKRSAWVAAANEMRREGKLNATDDALKANEAELLQRATKFAQNLNPMGYDNPGLSWDFAAAPSPRTLRRWMREAALLGEAGLIDNMCMRGNRNRRMAPEATGIMMQEVLKYQAQERPTKRVIFDNVEIAFGKANQERAEAGLPPLDTPSRETVRRAINALDPFTVMVAREGLEAARKKFMPAGMGLNLTRLGQRIEIDEHTIDLLSLMHSSALWNLMTEEERLAVGLDNTKARWVLTVAICTTSRCILGMVISRGAKATAAVQCLQMIISDKGQWSDGVRARGPWDMHLTPELIVTDNGTAFKSEAFRMACADLGISVESTVAGMPQQRGRNERFFATLTNAVPPVSPGRTFSDILTKGDADPRARAVLTFDDLAFALVRWIVDGYHNTPHRGLDGETPAQCWRRLSAQYGVTPPPDLRRWRLVFGEPLVRKVTKEGLTVLGVRYHSERLALWMNRNGEAHIDVRWHPRDIGAVEVRLGTEWFEIPALDPMMEGKAAKTWMTATNNLRAAHPKRKSFDREVVLAAMEAIQDRNATAMAAAGLLVDEWSETRIKKIETTMFQGSFCNAPAQPAPVDGGFGQSIPGPEDTANPLSTSTAKQVQIQKRQSGVSFEE